MSHRSEQVASVLQKEVSAIIAKDLEPPRDCLITIMRATVSPDLKHATLFVSILPDNKTGSAMTLLERKKGEIQHLLNKKLTMKFSPRIHWELDLTTRKYDAIDRALKQ